MSTFEIPALGGEFGAFSVRSGYAIGAEQLYPTHPVLNSEGNPLAWVRHIFPIASGIPKIISGELYGTYEPGSPAEQQVHNTFEKRVLQPLREGKRHDFPDKLGILEDYGMQVAPRWDVVATVDNIPSLLRVTPHIEGVPLKDWLQDESVPIDIKHAEITKHVTSLSSYARDTAVGRMEGKTNEEAPFFFDVPRTDQYLVTPNNKITLVDTGDESVRAGQNFLRQLFIFHVRFASSGISGFLNDETHQTIVDDLDTVREAFLQTSEETRILDEIEMEYKHPGWHLD